MSVEELYFEYKMFYDPSKRVEEITKIIEGFIFHINTHTSISIECENIQVKAEEILSFYNEIMHTEIKPIMVPGVHVSRSKVIAGTQFAIMIVLPLTFSETSETSPLSLLRLNANLCWAFYNCIVLDFHSAYDGKANALKRHFRHDPELELRKNDYIKWLTSRNCWQTPVLITSWYLDLLTDRFLELS
ncbi:MAG TPA: hypothetical protein VFG10_09375 [Saprospiraceae bacterium]|nr:hypothetical protein [Saprospiraceae bacterium]